MNTAVQGAPIKHPIYEKLRTGLWFLRRPSYWEHAGALVLRKFITDRDAPPLRQAATRWAEGQAVSVPVALEVVGLLPPGCSEIPDLDAQLVTEAEARASSSAVRMGGAADLQLLHAAVVLADARRVVETGVAYGWSSLAILSALEGREGAQLASVDMPYPKMGNEAFVGVVVPERLRSSWRLIREPDRRGLDKAIASLGGAVDVCHYDSDKSYWGRRYGFELMWRSLRPGGVFISDDIQDNMAFREFMERVRVPFAVTTYIGKYIGIARKPQEV